MKQKTHIEEMELDFTNEVVRDVVTGEVVFEEVTCETSTRLPVLKMDDMGYKVVPFSFA